MNRKLQRLILNITHLLILTFPSLILAEANVININNYQTMKIKPTKIVVVNTYKGRIEPLERVMVRSETSGTVEWLNFAEGKNIQENQVLVHVSTERLILQEKLAKSNYHLAESEYLVQKQLYDQNVTTISKLNSYTNRLDVTKIQLNLAHLNMEKSKVKSPITGVVKSKLVQKGETVDAGQNLMNIMNISKVLAKIKIPENDMVYVYPGKSVTVYVDSLPGQKFSGKIKTLGLEADTETAQFPAEIEIDNSNKLLFPGIAARVEIVVLQKDNQVLIPQTAIFVSKEQMLALVDRQGQVFAQPVSLGVLVNGQFQITKGLNITDKIVIPNPDQWVDTYELKPFVNY